MIIEIESVYGDTVVCGKSLEQNKLRMIVKELLTLVGEQAFASSFCLRYGYEPISYDKDMKIDYTIDLDTHMVIKPK